VNGGQPPAFKIAVYSSLDGVSLDQELAIADGDTTLGSHTLTIAPTFDDMQDDYYLIAVVDSNDDVPESDETNNTALFSGGAFVVHEIQSGKTVLQIQGTDANDSSFNLAPGLVDEVHFRGHAGNDTFDSNSLFAGIGTWLFGGDGDDSLTGSSGSDFIFGGLGDDT